MTQSCLLHSSILCNFTAGKSFFSFCLFNIIRKNDYDNVKEETRLKDPIVKESIHTSKETKNAGRHYATITEVFDFGPHISKIILDTECELAGAVLSPSQFEVEVTRTSTLGEDFEWPQFMGAKPDDSMHGRR